MKNPRTPAPGRPSRTQALVLEVIRNQPEPISVEAVATALHRHPNTVREHLTWLVEHGFARRVRVPGPSRGRPAWHYEARALVHPEAELAVELARQLAAVSPDATAAALAAGRHWGRRLVAEQAEYAEHPEAPSRPARRTAATSASRTASTPARGTSTRPAQAEVTEAVVGHLDALGYGPVPQPATGDVTLTRCPLLQAAYQHPEVVCAVHLGLIRTIVDEHGGRGDDVNLIPFSAPGECLLHLSRTGTTGADMATIDSAGAAPGAAITGPLNAAGPNHGPILNPAPNPTARIER